ncbi:hypothetical protein [Streptomyces sp. NPDC054863]
MRAETRKRIGPYGVRTPPLVLGAAPVAELRARAARIERLGYGSLCA